MDNQSKGNEKAVVTLYLFKGMQESHRASVWAGYDALGVLQAQPDYEGVNNCGRDAENDTSIINIIV